jgi:NAD(P)-dependent dehydrogenase (short-subunit alcohol dehydrogenase family)
MRGLSGKRIVIAGGGNGIGAGTAERLGTEGATVVVGDINLDAASTASTTSAPTSQRTCWAAMATCWTWTWPYGGARSR